ncbi:MAG: methionine--tRNA ligase [Cyanobacteriota bacterium]
MGKFYITTAIDYVNGAPHIGHAYEKILTDAIARHYRSRGDDIFFLTGTDEHGTKIQKTALEQNKTPKELTDENSSKFKAAWKDLNVSYDGFIRTTEYRHYAVVNHIFKTLKEQGDIYKASYTGTYCNGCEKFITPKELVDGKCPNHNEPPVEIREENYFFAITKYKDRLIDHINNHPQFILPEFRKNEILNQLENLEDISVSRARSSVSWGIPVPDDEEQTIYVWIDALSNYITGIGYLQDEETFNRYWPANAHVIGKDITKFHAIFWPCMLMAMNIALPESLVVHGFITVDESKMSKSIGNIVNPLDVTKKYDLEDHDALRYYLLSNAHLGKDVNFTEDDFVNKVDADLANNLGNLLNRTLSMLVKYNNGIIPEKTTSNELSLLCEETRAGVLEEFNIYQAGNACSLIIKLVDNANKYINNNEPWGKAKNPETFNECLDVLYNVLETLRWVSIMIMPFVPNIADKMMYQLGMSKDFKTTTLNSLSWGGLEPGMIIDKNSISPVFLRIGSQLATDKKKK